MVDVASLVVLVLLWLRFGFGCGIVTRRGFGVFLAGEAGLTPLWVDLL